LPCKKEICTRLFQPDFVALLIYRSIGRSPAIRSISFKCCSKATDFGSSQSAAQVLGVKPSVASAGSDLDFDNASPSTDDSSARRALDRIGDRVGHGRVDYRQSEALKDADR
jgi:hypothetical protein